MDFERIRKLAGRYEPLMTRFLRDMVALPSESCGEEAVIARIGEEMEAVGFDAVTIDAMGNIRGTIGSGPRLVAFDAHVDTVGVGERANWTFDPYEGYEDERTIGGRGTSDQEGGMASMVYGAKIMKELGLFEGLSVVFVGSVQEEDCDGLCWQYLHNEVGLRPEVVVLTEPTDGRIHRGQRGRMEIAVRTRGVSCHGSAPERGDNAIYKMAPILTELRALHANLRDDPFLGRGSLAVSEIFHSSPSRCAVADGCRISVDRRLTAGETADSALTEIRNLPAVVASGAEVFLYRYDRPSYRGLVYPTECYFPAWVVPEEHEAVRAMAGAFRSVLGREPVIDKWTFSTNGVSIMGRYAIPCVGLGPGHEDQAHAPDERTWKSELVDCAAVYAAFPSLYRDLTGSVKEEN
ncbi:MAG: YgeY family selenium metabolism-linked hydrolase [Synergistaceae bacterium]|nr:YgeY family selenium metabolism-linked hydrolase [Synergistaceae bacterium]